MGKKESVNRRFISPISTSGTGYSYEDEVACYYMLHLLCRQSPHIGILEVIDSIQFQARNYGWIIDDFVIRGYDSRGQSVKIAVCSRKSKTITANGPETSLLTDLWNQFDSEIFIQSQDYISIVTPRFTPAVADSLIHLIKHARDKSASEMNAAIEEQRFGKKQIALYKGFGQNEKSEIPKLLARLIPFELDFDSNFSTARQLLQSLSRSILCNDSNGEIQNFYNQLRLLRSQFGETSAIVDYSKLKKYCSERFELKVQTNQVSLEVQSVKSQPWFQKILSQERSLNRTICKYGSIRKGYLTEDQKTDLTLSSILESEKHILLVAAAGMGKTTELKKVAFQLQQNGKIPAWFDLKHYTDESIEQMLNMEIGQHNVNSLYIILDAFDEISSKHRNTIVSKLNFLIERHPAIRIVLSTRSSLFEGSEELHNFGKLQAYSLNPINIYSEDYKHYIETEYGVEADNFRKALYAGNCFDLGAIPFYVEPLIKHYLKHSTLSGKRTKLFEAILEYSEKADKKYPHDHTIDSNTNKNKVRRILEKMAVAMECMGKNYLEVSEINELISEGDINLIKLSALIETKTEPQKRWSFQDHQIQEYLVANQLCLLSFEKVKNLISFPDSSVIKPSWLNTLALLLSALDRGNALFNQLVEWLKENRIEYLLECEPDKLDNDIKHSIFETIFKKYSERETWFQERGTERKLARLVPTDYSVKFLTNQMRNASSRYGILNAIYVLFYIENFSTSHREELEVALIDSIFNNLKDDGIVTEGLTCLVETQSLTVKSFNKLYPKLKHRNDQHIRYSTYSAIEFLEVCDENLDYLIEGLQLFHGNHNDRSHVHLSGEDRHLAQCFGKLKSVTSYQRIFQLIENEKLIVDQIVWAQVIDALLDNALDLLDKRNSLLKVICKWFYLDCDKYYHSKNHPAIRFFQKAGYTETIFMQTLQNSELSEYTREVILAQLYEPDYFRQIAVLYKNGAINQQSIYRIQYNLANGREDKTIAKAFVDLVRNELDLVLFKYTEEELKQQYQNKNQSTFDLLFSKDSIIRSVENLINRIESEEIEYRDLWNLHSDHISQEHFDIPKIARSTVEAFLGRKEKAKKSVLMEKLNRFPNWTNYQIDNIHNMLKEGNVTVSNDQIEFVQEWFDSKVYSIDFEKAATETASNLKLNGDAVKCCYFLRCFNFELKQEKLLEMMTFDYYDGSQQKTVGLDYLKSFLPIGAMKLQSIANIKRRLNYSQALENNIDFALEQCFDAARLPIIDFIKDPLCNGYLRTKTLKKFFEIDKEIELIEILFNGDYGLDKWSIADILIEHNRIDIVRTYAESQITFEPIHVSETDTAIRYALKSDSNFGLKSWIKFFVSGQMNPNQIDRIPFELLKSSEHIEDLMGLLDFGYLNDKEHDYWHKPSDIAFSGLYCISQQSIENLNLVNNRLLKFYESNKNKYEHIQFLHTRVDRMKNDFYLRQSQNSSIRSAIETLKENALM